MLFITIALSLTLVALIVLFLKKHQQRRLDDLAEREQSLPPLDLEPEIPATVTEATPDIVANAHADQSDVTENIPKDWKEKCKELRQAQQFEQALICAEQAWPQSQSYEQTAVTIRAAIKQAQQAGSPDAETWLQALYRAAAESSFLYDKVPGEPEMRWQTVARSYNRADLRLIPLPWNEIGVNELKLLTKTDRRLMIQAWGEPGQHVSARIHHHNKSKP